MAYRSSASAKSDTGGNLTATPAGVQANDYLGGFWTQDANPGAPTYPTGWTQRADASLSSPDGQDAFYADKVAAGGDSFAFTTAAGNANMLITAAWSGRDTTAPRTFVQPTTNGSSNASPVSAAAAGGTAVAGDDLAAFFASDQTVGSDVWVFDPPTSPGTFTERVDDHTTDWTAATLATLDNVSAGATGNITSTITRSSGTGNAGWRAVIVAIKAAAGGSTAVPVFYHHLQTQGIA